jgi:Protein of unknown function (DUF2782).
MKHHRPFFLNPLSYPLKSSAVKICRRILRSPEKEETITEYSVNGNVYMVKISPENAPAYYMIDTDGDGNLETQRFELEKGMRIPQWLLFSW